MDITEIIERLKNIAEHAVHTVGERPFIMSLDDGIAVREAIELLKKAETNCSEIPNGWIPFKTRPLTEEEKEEYPDCDNILDCELPEDGQEILVTIKNRNHEPVQYDEFYTDDGCYLDSGYEIGTEATAWMPLPKPYKEG